MTVLAFTCLILLIIGACLWARDHAELEAALDAERLQYRIARGFATQMEINQAETNRTLVEAKNALGRELEDAHRELLAMEVALFLAARDAQEPWRTLAEGYCVG